MNIYKKSEKNQRSEVIADIIDRMPMEFGRWVVAIVLFLVIAMLFLGWIIKYPDTVKGQIEINANYAPIKLIANTSGKLTLNKFKTQDNIKEGDYIAIIQNPADIDDVISITKLVKQFNIKATSFYQEREIFPSKVSLGDLNIKYYTFLDALQKICNYEKNNTFQKKRENLLQFIVKQNEMLEQDLMSGKIKEQILTISAKALRRDSALRNASSMAVSEDEFERTQITWLNTKESYQNLSKEISSIQLQINDAKNKIELNLIEKETYETQMYLDLFSTYNDLTDNIKLWEQKYVFKAPFDGKVEFLKFWSNNQFVQTGEDVFTIVPAENSIIGQVQLPTTGAGKIKIGCDVIIKLENYPFEEYGSIKGVVKSISLTTNTIKMVTQGNIETYLILVDLPEGLTTNYGSKLEFKYQIKGTADIIANDRRLLERLFDNLRYRVNK